MAGGDPLLTDVPISPMPPERFRVVLGDRYVEVEDAIARARESFAGRAIWHVNSTAVGGGVAELLHSLLAYARGAGVDVRWVVVGGQPHFFRVTKTLHNRLHGLDGEPLTEEDEREYREVMEANAEELAALVRPGDFVYLHDPQTAGMTERMVEAGAIVIWRCHIGADEPTEIVRSAWSFLRPMLANAHQYVFSRRQYAWEGLDPERIAVIEPSIDAFSPKNEELSKRTVRSILDRIGLSPNGHEPAVFRRQDGSVGRVDRVAAIDQELPVPSDARLVTQVSRWDRLKDPIGVLEGFAGHVSDEDVHLLLSGRWRTASPTTPRALRCWSACAPRMRPSLTTFAPGSISSACRWTTRRRTRRWSTRSSVARP
jgi:trehalose synthase